MVLEIRTKFGIWLIHGGGLEIRTKKYEKYYIVLNLVVRREGKQCSWISEI